MQGTQLRDVYKKLESQIKAGSTYIESGRNVSDSMRDFSTRLVPETPLGILLLFFYITFHQQHVYVTSQNSNEISKYFFHLYVFLIN